MLGLSNVEDRITARRPGNTKTGQNADAFRVIMISEKRYKPMVSAIVTCIPMVHISQTARVRFGQMKIAYPLSSTHVAIPTTGKTYLHEIRTEGGIKLNGGEVKARHT